MGHIHSVYDTDNHFKVDGITRAISDVSSKKTSLVQCDHNSERFTFEIPRYIEGHDMLTCNSVSVRYRNGASGGTTKGKYKVTDFQVSPNDDKVVICSWLISKNATKYVGPLKFQLRFECVTGTKPDYVWNTIAYTGITVQESFDEFDVEESEGDTGDDEEESHKLAAPTIYLSTTDSGTDTSAVLGEAVLGEMILGDTGDTSGTGEKLSAPVIRLETLDNVLIAPVIKLVEA